MQMTIRSKRLGDGAQLYEAWRGERHPLREIDGLAQSRRYELGDWICSEGRGCEYWYRVVKGAARRIAQRADGGRQTIDILAPGDYFGFFVPDDRGFVIEAAADDTIVSLYPRWCVDFLVEVDAATRQALGDLELDAISRTRVHLFFGRRMTPAAKVSSFLLDMENRVSCDDAGWFELPISLAEIADYLVLSQGTVSWLLMLLAGQRIIARAGDRRLRILDRSALEDKEIVLAAERPRWPIASYAGDHGARRAVREDPLDEIDEASGAISR
jgi:CRP/FNR family nitrogen fixation transcriptional regulator